MYYSNFTQFFYILILSFNWMIFFRIIAIYSLIITKLLISFPKKKKKKKSLPAHQSITLQEYLICHGGHGGHSGHVSELGCSLVTWLT